MSYMIKYRTIFFMNARMHKMYGTDFDYIFQKKVALPILNPESTIFGLTHVLDDNFLIANHLLLIFKYDIYNSRVNNSISFQSLTCATSQIKYIEETISSNDLNKKGKISNKWKLIDHLF